LLRLKQQKSSKYAYIRRSFLLELRWKYCVNRVVLSKLLLEKLDKQSQVNFVLFLFFFYNFVSGTLLNKIEIVINFMQVYGLVLTLDVDIEWPSMCLFPSLTFFYISSELWLDFSLWINFLAFDIDLVFNIPQVGNARIYKFIGFMMGPLFFIYLYRSATTADTNKGRKSRICMISLVADMYDIISSICLAPLFKKKIIF